MDASFIEQVRSFNRAVTQRIGALDESYLAQGRPLGEARLIFEVGKAGCLDVRALRRLLGLDSGYLSRLLRSLERQKLIEVSALPEDRRVRQVSLTEQGQAAFKTYDSLSDQLARSMLAPLSAPQRARLASAMAEAELLLRASAIEISLEPADSEDARWCLRQYYAELARRFEGGFDTDLGNAAGDAGMKPPHGFFLIARQNGEPVGCGALKSLEPGVGEIKRVWIADEVRGLGLASRILSQLEALAVEASLPTLRLDTNRALTEAHALYRKLGYREIDRYNDNPYAHHWFEKRL